METISYITSLIATILGLCEPFGKKMRTILIFNFAGNLLVCISYFLTGSYSGAAICVVACVQVVVNFFFDVRGKKVPVWLVLIYAAAFLSVNLITFAAWYDVFSLVAAMLFVLSVAQSSAKYYRILYASNSTVWIFYDFLSGSYGNLATHIVLFAATSIAMLVHDRKQKISEK